MKKVRNFIIIFAIALCAIIIPGKVDAATASNFKVYCPQKTVGVDTPVNCYLLAVIDNEGVYSVKASIRSTEKLDNQGGFVLDTTKMSVNQINHTNDGTCDAVGNCFEFTAKDGFTINNNAGKNSLTGTDAVINTEQSAYTVVGYWTLKLQEDATDENCGKICVEVDYKATSSSTESVSGLNNPTLENGGCAEIRPVANVNVCKIEGDIYYDKEGNVVTKEEYEASCQPNEETGSFASYAVLAAGAFIALSAITIAKKHNKFYRV